MLAPYIIITENELGERKEYTSLYLTSIPREQKIALAKREYEKDGYRIVFHSF